MASTLAKPLARRRLLKRPERREAILAAAASAFAKTGFAGTSLDDVAAAAGVSRVVIYRHFDTKNALYRAVLDHIRQGLNKAIGGRLYGFSADTLRHLVDAARADPDGFRLLFHHAVRETEFRDYVDDYRSRMSAVAEQNLRNLIPDRALRMWASRLVVIAVPEAIISWLDAGQPEPDAVAERVLQISVGLVQGFTGRSLP
jgi:AcrR family transcriptional regulator